MTVQTSVAVADAMLDAYETQIGTSPKLVLRTGAPPANCAASRTGTVIATITLPSDWMANAASRSKALAGTWAGTAAAAGTVGHYCIMDSSNTTCHEQGTVSPAGTAWAISTAYILGQYVTNGGNVYINTQAGTSASSGGPTGTGSAITDNTAKWNYVSAVGDMTLDNTTVNISQSITVSSKTLTDNNG